MGRAFCAQTRVLCLSALLCTLFAFAFLALTPEPAHATYADVATSYGTIEELSPKTDTVDAADVPEGTYNDIEVRTSSSFCAVSNCTLKKSGDTLLAAFTLSKTYTAIYLGTADEAAAQTDASGDDDSAYIIGKPIKVGSKTLNQFTIAIPAVSEPFYIATFNGGSQSHTKACWYDRSFIFDASSSLLMAVQSGTASKDSGDEPSDNKDSDKDKDKDDKKDSKSDSDSSKKDEKTSESDKDNKAKTSAAASSTSKSDKKQETKTEDKKKDTSKKEKEADESPKAAAASKSGTGSGGSGSGSGSSSKDGSKDQEKEGADSDSGSSTPAATHSSIPGVPLSFVSAELVPDELDTSAAEAEKKAAGGLGPDAMMVLIVSLFFALVLVGIAMRIVLFKRAGGTLGRI